MIPEDAGLSPIAQDLIKRLVSDSSERLGLNGVAEIQIHPFFKGINWGKLRQRSPPFKPLVFYLKLD